MTVQSEYGDLSAIHARAGLVHGATRPSTIGGHAVGLGAKKLVTVTVTADANDQEHVLTVGTAELSFTSDASGTKAEIAIGLTAKINTTTGSASVAYAVASADTILIYGREYGDDFTFSESDSNLTNAETTSASDPADLPFGVGVLVHSSNSAHVQLPAHGTAQITTATPTNVNDAVYGLTVSFDRGDGATESYSAMFVADASASVKEIVDELTAELNTALPSNTVAVTDDDSIMTLTAEIAGLTFLVAPGAASSTATWAFSTTTASVEPQPFAGVSLHQQRAESEDSDGFYAGGTIAQIGESDIDVWVLLDASQTPSPGDEVWTRVTTSGVEQAGAFRTAQDAGDCIHVKNCKWIASGDGSTYLTGLDGNLIGLLRVLA